MSTRNPGMNLQLEVLPYPLTAAAQNDVVQLLLTEWSRTDYSWREAMQGDYSGELVILTVLARIDGRAVATATIHFPRHQPEVAVLGNVLTHRDYRGHGLAAQVIDAALAEGIRAGCSVCLLGTARQPHNVYLRHGFAWHNGAVMRRSFRHPDFEAQCFAAGQPCHVRAGGWGDLPGLTLLVSQPLASASLDFPHGLVSGRHARLERCLSNFPTLWYDTVPRGGLLAMLTGTTTGRIFGFGTVTLDAAAERRHEATLDLVTHDHYESELPRLLDFLLAGCRELQLRQVHAVIAAGDEAKLRSVRAGGFQEVRRLPAALQLSHSTRDLIALSRSI